MKRSEMKDPVSLEIAMQEMTGPFTSFRVTKTQYCIQLWMTIHAYSGWRFVHIQNDVLYASFWGECRRIQCVLYCDSRNDWILHCVQDDVMRGVILRRMPKNPVILAYCNSKNKSFHWGLEASSNAIFFFRFQPFNSFSRWIAKRISLYSSKYPSLSTP